MATLILFNMSGRVKRIKVAAMAPPTTIKTEGMSTNAARLPPSRMALTIRTIPETKPITVPISILIDISPFSFRAENILDYSLSLIGIMGITYK